MSSHHRNSDGGSVSPRPERPAYAQLAHQSFENSSFTAVAAVASPPSGEALAVESSTIARGGPARRTTMSDLEQTRRRASIKHILADPSLSQLEKSRSIQQLMDGRNGGYRRSTIDSGAAPFQREKRILRRTSSSDDVADSTADDDLPITANTRHFSYIAAFPSSSYQHNNTIDNYDDNDDGSSSNYLSELVVGHKTHSYSATTTLVPAEATEAFAGHQNRRGSNEPSRLAIEMAPKCTHYSRNCHIVSPCCGATFGCRICHDDCPVLPPLLEQKMMPPPIHPPPAASGGEGAAGSSGAVVSTLEDDYNDNINKSNNDNNNSDTTTPTADATTATVRRYLRTSSMPTSFTKDGPPEHHNLNRFAICEIICRKCFTRQGSKTNNCVKCGIQFGEYHCAICNLWMSNEERPYHCPDCGFCRVGGGENFRHCQDCGMCIDKQLFQGHNCKVGKYMSNCPVCQEDLFSSRDASHELPCGHAIHWHCFKELASHDSRCPMCKKTAETHERMLPTWNAMAMGIALQPLPPELAKVVTIKCNDCEIVQVNRSWHFLGVRCSLCESFNTVVERITMIGHEAHEFLMTVDQHSTPSAAAGRGQQQQITTSATIRPARRRRATVDSAVAPSVSFPRENHH